VLARALPSQDPARRPGQEHLCRSQKVLELAPQRGMMVCQGRRVRSCRPETPVREGSGEGIRLKLSYLTEPLKIELVRAIALMGTTWVTAWATLAKRSRRHSHNCCASNGQSHRHVHTH
jgi:hypothetical protein